MEDLIIMGIEYNGETAKDIANRKGISEKEDIFVDFLNKNLI